MDPDQLDTQAQEDADLDAGFNDTPTETPAVAEPAQDQPAEQPAAAPKYAQITEEQWNDYVARAARIDSIQATLDKVSGTAFGKIGGVERTLNTHQEALERIQSGNFSGAEPADFTRLLEDFPDLAEMVVEGINNAMKRTRGSAAPDLGELEAKFEEKRKADREELREQLVRDFETKLLTREHRDWRSVIAGDEFKTYLSAKPAEYQSEFNATLDSDFVGQALTEFKASHAKPAPASDADTRRGRLDAAVTPRGTGGHHATTADDDQDDFEAGFKQVRSG